MMAGFASASIAVDAGLDAEASFEVVILRLEQTLLGLLTYTVVFILVWPTDGYALFKSVCCKLVATQQQLYRGYRELIHGQSDHTEKLQAARTLRMQAIQ